MDREARTANIVKELYKYKRTGESALFVKEVCRYFDYVKDLELSTSDAHFLLFLANEAGIPHYFNLLELKHHAPELREEDISLLAMGAFIHDSSLIVNGTKLHRYQKEVLDRFIIGGKNRYVLTAPTSFGKTYIVYEIISKMEYRNILLVFPSISLLSENFSKLSRLDRFDQYQIHTLSEEAYSTGNKNIFVFTPERYLSFLDKNKDVRFDFSFIDEVYKIDNSFIIDQETTGENERDIAYRLALEYICNSSDDMMLAGPYMTLPNELLVGTASFANFAGDNGFTFLVYNDIEIVDKDYEQIKKQQTYTINGKTFYAGSAHKADKIANIITALSTPSENTIIYCGRRSSTESYSKEILANHVAMAKIVDSCKTKTTQTYIDFVRHLEQDFGSDWIVVKALKGYIGIHHSLIPKYIQKEIINLFNQGILLALFSTTTITEGVNTTAKNIVVTSSKKGKKILKQFDAKNIAGRAGRFFQHYVGRVIAIDKDFINIINGDEDILNHKNYDENSTKTDVDFQITKEKYLSKSDLTEKQRIDMLVRESNIPPDIFNAFRIVGPIDKLNLYQEISRLTRNQISSIQMLAQTLARSKATKLDWNGFQLIMDTIRPIVKESHLIELIDLRVRSGHSLVTVLLSSFLEGGYTGMVRYYVEQQRKPKDEAIHKVSDYVYNVFKYHLVKYLGLFDIFYKYMISMRTNRSMDDVSGIGILLQKLEYNTLTPNARRLSDYGVPFRLVSYYDQDGSTRQKIFDAYEQHIDNQIQSLLE